MQTAAHYLEGTHDFKSFATENPQVTDTVRTIYRTELWRDAEDMIHFQITGNGFLYNMVRIIAGTLMEIGEGKYPPEHMKDILEAASRAAAGPTAPARGLTLVKMEYENDPRKEAVH